MDSRCLLALLVIGCSSSSHSANRSSSGGNSNGGGSSNGDSDSGYSSDNSACSPWPQAKLFPWVGPFFYGPAIGPCSYTETDQGANAFTPVYTYTDGVVTLAATPNNRSQYSILLRFGAT